MTNNISAGQLRPGGEMDRSAWLLFCHTRTHTRGCIRLVHATRATLSTFLTKLRAESLIEAVRASRIWDTSFPPNKTSEAKPSAIWSEGGTECPQSSSTKAATLASMTNAEGVRGGLLKGKPGLP